MAKSEGVLPGVLALMLLASASWADVIVFHDGRTLEGEVVKQEGDILVIKGRFGIARVNRREVKEIQKEKSPREKIEEKWMSYQGSNKKSDAPAVYELFKLADTHLLDKYKDKLLKKTIELDPDHVEARKELGYVRYLGEWITFERRMELEGKVKVGNQWISKDDEGGDASAAQENQEQEPDLKSVSSEEAKALIRERMEKLTGISGYSKEKEEQVKCLQCSGDGMLIWVPCDSCKRSDKPGYRFLGTSYQQCERCRGATRFPGAGCPMCTGTGRIFLSRFPPWQGGVKSPPLGFQWCQTCKGAKYEAYQKCLQCKDSKWPGYYMELERIHVCNRCLGLGKLPETVCKTCSGTGLLKTPKTQEQGKGKD